VESIWQTVQDTLGGGGMTLWLVIGGVVLLWLALKAVKMVVRLALFGLGGAMLIGTAPWTGADVPGAVAACAVAEVSAEADGWQSHITKRVTAEEVSSDAACASDGVGLSSGSAVVRLRTIYDVPFQTWDVTPDGAEPRLDLPTS
jgi:hypothetical protein